MMERITADNLNEYLERGENNQVEFKSCIPMSFELVDKLVSAFSNTLGGVVIFGYDEINRRVVGVNKSGIEKLILHYSKEPFNDICKINMIPVEMGMVVILEVEKSKKNIYIDKISYFRQGKQIFEKDHKVRSDELQNFIDEIQYKNRNPKDTKVLKLLDEIDTNPVRKIDSGTHIYRSRIIENEDEIGNKDGFLGYGSNESFVPPAKVTRDLRANYRYIPYLYCSNLPYISLVEVRPRIGSDVSIATINVKSSLELLDFTIKKHSSNLPYQKRILFEDLSMLFSKPVKSGDDTLDYIPTQYIAEYVKKLNYDGIVYRSSLTPELDDSDHDSDAEIDGYNIVVFNYDKCEPIGSNVVTVTHNYVECEQTDGDKHELDIDYMSIFKRSF